MTAQSAEAKGGFILLIQPKTALIDIEKSSPALPLSLLFASAFLAKIFPFRLFDERTDGLFDVCIEKLRANPPLLAGITAITGRQVGYAEELARSIRSSLSVPVVWGGKHALFFSNELLLAGVADYVVRGDGEKAFLELACAIRDERDLSNIQGLSYIVDGQIIEGSIAPHVDLESIDSLPYSMLKHRYLYLKRGVLTGVMETSRGCPYRCTFCYNSVGLGSSWRGAGAKWVVERLKELKVARPQTGHVDFVDDNFFVDKERALAIGRAIASEVRLHFTCNGGRISDLLRYSDDDFNELARAGLERVDIGVETASPKVRELLNKDESVDQVHEVCRKLTRAGVAPWINLMVGFPDETKEDMAKTARLADELLALYSPLYLSPIYGYKPYPKTPLFENLRARGFELPSDSKMQKTAWSEPHSPWLKRWQKRLIANLYFYSLFMDEKILLYRDQWWIRVSMKVLIPIARMRVRHLWFCLPVLKWLYNLFRGGDY